MTFGALYGQEQLQGIHIPEAEAQIQREEEEFEASELRSSYQSSYQSCYQDCLVRMALLWQHTACCCLYDIAHVSCMSRVHPVLFSLHMYAAVYDM